MSAPITVLSVEFTDPSDRRSAVLELNQTQADFLRHFDAVQLERCNYQHISNGSVDPSKFAMVLVGGVTSDYPPHSVEDPDRIRSLAVLQQLSVPRILTCLSMQTEAYRLGGRLQIHPQPEQGFQLHHLTANTALLSDLPPDFSLYMMHYVSVETLPAGYTQVAATDVCRNALAYNELEQSLMIQGHIELSGSFGELLFSNFQAMVLARKQLLAVDDNPEPSSTGPLLAAA